MKVLIADDERVAREGLRDLLAREPDVEIVGEAATGADTLRLLRGHAVDVVLLDVRMPRMTGLDVVAAIGPARMPIVIFVTAHDEHAVRAFELHALDYLVKPYREERLREAMHRAREHLRHRRAGELGQRLEAWMRESGGGAVPGEARPRTYAARVRVEDRGRIRFVAVRDILWVEAQDYCVELHLAGERILRRETLKQFLAGHDPRLFVRVHRSAAVNVRHVRELSVMVGGALTARLTNDAEIAVARSYRASLEERLRTSP